MATGVGLVTFFVTILTLVGYLLYRQMRVWYIMSKFGGPTAWPIVGNSLQLGNDRKERFNFLDAIAKKHGPVARFYMGPVPFLYIFNADDAETIMSSSKHLSKGFFYDMIVPWLGTGLLISKGNKWFKRRKLITPSFHFNILNSFIDVFNEKTLTLCTKLEDKGLQPVNIVPLITSCTLDVICDTAMGKNIRALEGQNSDYVESVHMICGLLTIKMNYPWLWFDQINKRFESGKRVLKHLNILHGMTNSVITERKAERASLKGNGGFGSSKGVKKLAFLDLLLDEHEKDPSFDIESIREEVDTFMFEGHDTTASSISWSLYNIGRFPEIQNKIHAELDEIFGEDCNRHVTTADLHQLQYLHCVIKESLRLFPPVPLIGRETEEDVYLNGKYVPKGTLTTIGIFWIHRDPRHFPDPEKFDPDRFLPKNVSGRHPFAYVPFSAGPRNCIGQKFAMMETKVAVINILRRFQVKTLEEVFPIFNFVLRPYGDKIVMQLIPRHKE